MIAIHHGGKYSVEHHFAPDFGFADVQRFSSEAAAVMYLFNRWPTLRIHPAMQCGEVSRVTIWIFAGADQREPCAVVAAAPDFRPDWELWRPYFEMAR